MTDHFRPMESWDDYNPSRKIDAKRTEKRSVYLDR